MSVMGDGEGTTNNVIIEKVDLPGVHDAQEFIEAKQQMMRSSGVAASRGVPGGGRDWWDDPDDAAELLALRRLSAGR